MSADKSSQRYRVAEARMRVLTVSNVPAVVAQLGADWVEEWIWRANTVIEAKRIHQRTREELQKNPPTDVESSALVGQPEESRWGLGYEGEEGNDDGEDDSEDDDDVIDAADTKN
ncbi:hypothetical protein NX059_010421 [Plenodomus lindquistii]|nr:hypothetical protein NX059_010421 [Plenodomus lindquistii]